MILYINAKMSQGRETVDSVEICQTYFQRPVRCDLWRKVDNAPMGSIFARLVLA